jgi:hypothetical protein
MPERFEMLQGWGMEDCGRLHVLLAKLRILSRYSSPTISINFSALVDVDSPGRMR